MAGKALMSIHLAGVAAVLQENYGIETEWLVINMSCVLAEQATIKPATNLQVQFRLAAKTNTGRSGWLVAPDRLVLQRRSLLYKSCLFVHLFYVLCL